MNNVLAQDQSKVWFSADTEITAAARARYAKDCARSPLLCAGHQLTTTALFLCTLGAPSSTPSLISAPSSFFFIPKKRRESSKVRGQLVRGCCYLARFRFSRRTFKRPEGRELRRTGILTPLGPSLQNEISHILSKSVLLI